MGRGQLFQDVGVGARSSFCFLYYGKAELLEEDLSELLGRANV